MHVGMLNSLMVEVPSSLGSLPATTKCLIGYLIILYYTSLHRSKSHYSVLHPNIPKYTSLLCILPNFNVLQLTIGHIILLYCTSIHHTTPHFTVLHFTLKYYNTPANTEPKIVSLSLEFQFPFQAKSEPVSDSSCHSKPSSILAQIQVLKPSQAQDVSTIFFQLSRELSLKLEIEIFFQKSKTQPKNKHYWHATFKTIEIVNHNKGRVQQK